MGRNENVIVFKDTENLCKTNPRISEAVKRSISAQKLILEGDALAEQKKDLYEDAANVIVTKKRTFEAAAPNLRNQPSNQYNSGDGNRQIKMKDNELLVLHEKKLRRILEVALSEGCETIILGAFGCGAFQNNPEVVALANRNVIKEYLHAFKNIEFAVYCPPSDNSNYKVFERVLKEYCN